MVNETFRREVWSEDRNGDTSTETCFTSGVAGGPQEVNADVDRDSYTVPVGARGKPRELWETAVS